MNPVLVNQGRNIKNVVENNKEKKTMAKAGKMNRAGVSSKKNEVKPIWDGHGGTKPEMVIKVLDNKVQDYFEGVMSDIAVVAKDGDGLYITGKSYTKGNIYDPYRMYKRDKQPVSLLETIQAELDKEKIEE